jgi:hypothetical protein
MAGYHERIKIRNENIVTLYEQRREDGGRWFTQEMLAATFGLHSESIRKIIAKARKEQQ